MEEGAERQSIKAIQFAVVEKWRLESQRTNEH